MLCKLVELGGTTGHGRSCAWTEAPNSTRSRSSRLGRQGADADVDACADAGAGADADEGGDSVEAIAKARKCSHKRATPKPVPPFGINARGLEYIADLR